jgi:hypothetical protein
MKGSTICIALGAALALSACQRPQEVREVARLSKPIVVRVQQSGTELATRMSLQTAHLKQRAEILSAQEASARAHTAAVDRDLRLAGDKEALRKLEIFREADAQLLADPLASVRAPAAAKREREDTVKIDLGPLTKTVAALDRLSGAERMSYSEIGLFLKDVNDELKRLESESAAAAEPPEAN